MSASCYDDLKAHVGHKVAVVQYGDGANVAIECTRCHEVLLDFDREPEDEVPETPDEIQFARLLEEAQQAGAFTPEIVDVMAAEMDLPIGQVHELLDRARLTWEAAKAK